MLQLQQLPVLFASGNNDEIDSLCLSLGALGFVLKPVQRHILYVGSEPAKGCAQKTKEKSQKKN